MKQITVIINGTPKEAEKRDYTFEEVVILAYGSYNEAAQEYIMTSISKNGKEQDYSVGDKIKMKEDMVINVDSTNKS